MPKQKKAAEKILPSKEEIIPPKVPSYEIIVLITGLVLLLLLFYTVQSLLSPFILIGAIIFLLYPLRQNAVARNMMWLSIALFLFWFIEFINSVIAPFVFGLFLAYLLHPVVTQIEKIGVPRWSAALFVILLLLALFSMILLIALPYIVVQFEGILHAVGTMSSQFTYWLFEARFIKLLKQYGISTSQLQQIINNTISPRVQDVLNGILQVVVNLLGSLRGLVSGIVNIVILPFITFYLLKDFPLVKHRLKMMLPRSRRETAARYYHQIDEIVGKYIRGTTIIAIIDSAAVITGFSLLGIQYPLILGILSGILFFIPYFGFLTMLIVSSVVASLNPAPILVKVLSVLIFLVSLHITENYVLSPRIIGKKVGLHPILLLLSIFLFGYLLGFIGLLIAIPAAGSIIVIAKDWEARKRQGNTIAAITQQ
ncbi:MAG: AI-2E family transporter [Bacteroidetes bacterium]|nr:AI-2E family transporter [Bacteroidota bacterium]